VAHVGAARVQRQARERRMADALVQPRRCLDTAAGRRLMALLVGGGIGPPEQTGLRLACPRAAFRSGWPQIWMRNLAGYLK
jgi:hypothetical protein